MDGEKCTKSKYPSFFVIIKPGLCDRQLLAKLRNYKYAQGRVVVPQIAVMLYVTLW